MKDGKPIMIEVCRLVSWQISILHSYVSPSPTTQKTTLPYYDLPYLSPWSLLVPAFHGCKHVWTMDRGCETHTDHLAFFFLERKKMTWLCIKKIVYMIASLPRNNIKKRELCMFLSVWRLRYMVVLGRLKHCPAYVLFCEWILLCIWLFVQHGIHI